MKKIVRKLIVPGLGLSLLFTGGTAEAFASENVSNNSSTIKPIVKTSDMIASSKGKDKNKDKNKDKSREDFVKATLNHAYNIVGQGKKNVIVYNQSVREGSYTHQLHGYDTYYTVLYGDITYGVYVFDYGYFKSTSNNKKADWAFKGNCSKKGNTVSCAPL
ncbi:hypothetical protein ACIGHG_21205 [Bacillus sp. NPDC077411]|uniref:Uncharacterized protein n=1 Tax=Bacillus bruguierae TaxID=3127667 RepID=A0ABU8FML2_9BACI